MNVVERARAKAERRPPRFGFEGLAYVAGATDAATITPEQIEAAAEAVWETIWYEGMAWSGTSETIRKGYRAAARAAFRAAGFIVPEGEST